MIGHGSGIATSDDSRRSPRISRHTRVLLVFGMQVHHIRTFKVGNVKVAHAGKKQGAKYV